MSDKAKRNQRAQNRQEKNRKKLNNNSTTSDDENLIEECQQNQEYDIEPGLGSDI